MTVDEPWLAADDTAARALLPLAESLFRQQLDLGRLIATWALKPEVLGRFMRRIGVTIALLELLEETSSLRFVRAGLPYVSNTHRWQPTVSPVGVTGTGTDPAPSEVVHSLYLGWAAHSESMYPAHRPLRALTQLIHDYGFDAALLRLIELAAAGYVPRSALVTTLRTMLRARHAVANDHALVARLVKNGDGRVPPSDWAEVEIDATWLDSVNSGASFRPDLTGLITRAVDSVDLLRAATDFDEWVLRNANVGTVLDGLMAVSSAIEDGLPLGVRTVLSQLEENRADTYAFLGMMGYNLNGGQVAAKPMLDSYAWLLNTVAHGHGGDRLLPQRVSVPAAAGIGVREQPPPEWAALSYRTAAVVMPFFFDEFDLVRPTGETGGGGIRTEYERAAEATEAGNLIESIRIYEELLTDRPWSGLVRHELAIALDSAGRLTDALTVIVDALAMRPAEPGIWQSLRVILGHLGARDEYLRARAMTEYLSERP